MSEYCCVTYYNRGTEENPCWEVYAVVREYVNKNVGSYKTEQEAQQKAFSYCLPVMKGATNSCFVQPIIKRLEKVEA